MHLMRSHMVRLHSTYVYMLHSSWLAVSSCDVWQLYCGTGSRCLSEVQGDHAGSGRVNAAYNRVIGHHNAIAI